jgi:hypothetical protein
VELKKCFSGVFGVEKQKFFIFEFQELDFCVFGVESWDFFGFQELDFTVLRLNAGNFCAICS